MLPNKRVQKRDSFNRQVLQDKSLSVNDFAFVFDRQRHSDARCEYPVA
jgi:hypothetical protein